MVLWVASMGFILSCHVANDSGYVFINAGAKSWWSVSPSADETLSPFFYYLDFYNVGVPVHVRICSALGTKSEMVRL